MNDCYGVTYEVVGDAKENMKEHSGVDAIIASAQGRCCADGSTLSHNLSKEIDV